MNIFMWKNIDIGISDNESNHFYNSDKRTKTCCKPVSHKETLIQKNVVFNNLFKWPTMENNYDLL